MVVTTGLLVLVALMAQAFRALLLPISSEGREYLGSDHALQRAIAFPLAAGITLYATVLVKMALSDGWGF
jgi:hypothetical protein